MNPWPASSVAVAAPERPVVLLPACNRVLGEHPFHVVGEKYVQAVRLAGCLPLVVPSAQCDEITALLDLADGVLLTGSPSNVHPAHYGEAPHDPQLPLDAGRDGWTLPLIRQALARGVPLLGICRGTQEVNVALGGSLYQAVHEMPGHLDHRGADGAPDATAPTVYGPAHTVRATAGGLLERIVGHSEFSVNSVHGQAVKRLADGLQVQALAPDGVVEAFSAPGAGFSLCVQWHPEWQAADNPVSMAILHAFGRACRAWRDRDRHRHRGPEPESGA